MLFLYQRVGRRAHETVKSTLSRISSVSGMICRVRTYQRAMAIPQTVLAWKQLLRVTPAQWPKLEVDLLRFSTVAVTKALAYWASISADDLPMT